MHQAPLEPGTPDCISCDPTGLLKHRLTSPCIRRLRAGTSDHISAPTGSVEYPFTGICIRLVLEPGQLIPHRICVPWVTRRALEPGRWTLWTMAPISSLAAAGLPPRASSGGSCRCQPHTVRSWEAYETPPLALLTPQVEFDIPPRSCLWTVLYCMQ